MAVDELTVLVNDLQGMLVEALLGFDVILVLQLADRELELAQMVSRQVDDNLDALTGLVSAEETR